MSITDELREWWVRKFPVMDKELHEDFWAIADRIDAEHEEAIQQALMGEGGVPATDENMAEHGWVRLPKDADGEPIHVGDKVEEIDCDGGHRVFELRMCESGWWVTADGICRRPHKYRHYHAPTVEDVLTEMVAKVIERSELTNGAAQTIAEYAAKLRLAEGEDA